ncbi:MAG: penicillin-binding transpeptidase domain-containing protein [Candidatus Shapirobacteria bacterium]|nr:penicillin-binding transpeptidase domain-containing protein [Candidatus Shapirobacteria bacterium]
MIGFLVLVGRLFELQIIFGNKNWALAEGNRIKREILPAPRGMIYDRHSKELVRNVPIYRKLRSPQGGIPSELNNGEWIIISREEALGMEARGETENLRMDIGRDYLYGEALAHVLGYLGEANENEVKSGKFKAGDLVGRTGVEEQYDTLLRGQDGGEVYEVDTQGNKVREIGKIEPIPGKSLSLSIDAEISKIAYGALEKKPGTVVATEPGTGQILVLVSSPSFNPNDITQQILSDPALPFFNRAIGGVYPPGSTFKVVTAVAGLEEGKIDENTTWTDTGEIRVGDYSYKNWYFTQYGKTEGTINLVRAIKRSTDTFFYKVGEWVGPKKLSQWALAFGLGQKTGIDLPGEVGGLVPSPEWKEKTGDRWFLGNTYHFAIGQGDLLATPLQINMMTEVIASNGQLCSPKVEKTDGQRGKACQDLKLKQMTINLVKEGMKGVCSPGGTAFPFFGFQPQVACKSGTAEFVNAEGKTHAWLTSFAPVDNPEIVATALLEGGGEGSYVAAPVVKKVMEAWFHGD